MEEVEQIKMELPPPNENKASKSPSISKYDEKIKKIETELFDLSRKIDILYKSLRR